MASAAARLEGSHVPIERDPIDGPCVGGLLGLDGTIKEWDLLRAQVADRLPERVGPDAVDTYMAGH